MDYFELACSLARILESKGNKATNYRFCIQCRDLDSDTTGSFLYDHARPFHAVSPVFESCQDLFQWMRAHRYSTGLLADFVVYESEET